MLSLLVDTTGEHMLTFITLLASMLCYVAMEPFPDKLSNLYVPSRHAHACSRVRPRAG